ncbi:G-protein coupled receptor GRL101-like isoform X2 [Cimex lectularius]|uniref:G-protein coupled receptors family 1 profile domain-containing protein n=1 Tax=Cimex lectularius TaxID=79782 RepID=A0A8I6SIR2_CIMLE|nr:G-protein coupled receptor GRL101-like isoform X2 [Cimex lectularius]
MEMLLYFLALFFFTSSSEIQPTDRPGGEAEVSCMPAEDVFRCDETVCVAKTVRCNGIPDCPGAEDESVMECGCLENEFRCSNSCVDIVKRCDKHPDCAEGEDEKDCRTFICPTTHFKCNNHFCIPTEAVCNYQDDCGDGSDEADCQYRHCWHPEFTCINQECVPPGVLCDGNADCKDGSDEWDCTPENFVQCGDGSRIHKQYWCDGWPNCPDNHADELNCSKCDKPDEYKCSNGRCISRANVCDSQCDCVSANSTVCDDEIGCEKFYTTTNGMTNCIVGTSLACGTTERNRAEERCIASGFLCDGQNQCFNGKYLSDEFGCKESDVMSLPPSELFRCQDNRTLPKDLLCDFKIDCLDGDDETDCQASAADCAQEEFRCQNGQCVPIGSRCNMYTDCWDKTDEIGCHEVPCEEYRCKEGGQCVSNSSNCDFFLDCLDGSDEDNCTFVDCGPDEFRCQNGQCVDKKQRCFNSGNPREGCADLSHLIKCENVTCTPGQFKCKNGPCLNESLLCNKVIDCKDSWEDESNCTFHCSNSNCPCKDVHINCTGFGLGEIPETEKEITRFHFGGNRLNSSLHNGTFARLGRLVYLDLSNNSITHLTPMMFSTLWRLTVLNLQDNDIQVLENGTFYGLPNVNGLHLQGNRIRKIHALAFFGLSSLPNLVLRNLSIRNIEPHAFVGLRKVVSIDLSQNEIEHLLDGTLNGLPRLLYLNISSNRIKVIDPNVFRAVTTLEKLETDEFRFCCLAREVPSCSPPQDEFSSCEDLMSNMVLRVCVWALAVVATVGNLLVIACRARYKHCNQVHSFLITNLALGDLLMGSYLLLIALVDWHYRGVYIIHDSTWRSSPLCSFAGFISTFSSELSVFTLTVITLDRFLVIIFPFRVRRLEMKRTRMLMAFGWVIAACLSAIPLLHIDYFKNFYGRSGVCLALHITPDKPNGWEYSVFVFLFLNLVSFTVIAVGYLWMFLVARTTQHAVHKERTAYCTSESAMAWRMTLLVATDAACWVPIIILGVVSLAGFTVPTQVFAWVAVFILPLNAAVNPILYTLSTAPFLTPARHGFLSFRRSCKLSLSQDHRRTLSTGLNHYTGRGSVELYSMTRRSMRNSLDTSVTEQGVVLPLNKVK